MEKKKLLDSKNYPGHLGNCVLDFWAVTDVSMNCFLKRCSFNHLS